MEAYIKYRVILTGSADLSDPSPYDGIVAVATWQYWRCL
jgi:hypothetical protein